MNIGGASRPRDQQAEYHDFEKRNKCTVCCAAYNCMWVFGVSISITFPCSLAVIGRKVMLASWKSALDHALFFPLPLTLVTFTHQMLLSESLWSKNKKSVFDCNVDSSFLNVGLWAVAIGAGTYISRFVLVNKSNKYRLIMWDYRRKNRAAINKYIPAPWGSVMYDLDWYNVAACLWLYHALWAFATLFLDRSMGAHYAMFAQSTNFSKRCSPRWREWREQQIREKLDNTHRVIEGRWKNNVSNETWRSSHVDK